MAKKKKMEGRRSVARHRTSAVNLHVRRSRLHLGEHLAAYLAGIILLHTGHITATAMVCHGSHRAGRRAGIEGIEAIRALVGRHVKGAFFRFGAQIVVILSIRVSIGRRRLVIDAARIVIRLQSMKKAGGFLFTAYQSQPLIVVWADLLPQVIKLDALLHALRANLTNHKTKQEIE